MISVSRRSSSRVRRYQPRPYILKSPCGRCRLHFSPGCDFLRVQCVYACCCFLIVARRNKKHCTCYKILREQGGILDETGIRYLITLKTCIEQTGEFYLYTI